MRICFFNRDDYYFLLFILRMIKNMVALTIMKASIKKRKYTQLFYFFLNLIKYCYMKQKKWVLEQIKHPEDFSFTNSKLHRQLCMHIALSYKKKSCCMDNMTFFLTCSYLFQTYFFCICFS